MNTFKSIFYTSLLTLLIFAPAKAQQDGFNWRVGAGYGYSNYYGDLSNYSISLDEAGNIFNLYSLNTDGIDGDVSNLDESQLSSFAFSLERRLSNSFGLLLQYTNAIVYASDRLDQQGNLAPDNPNFARGLNFKSEVQDVSAALVYHFANGKILKKEAFLSPYLRLGIGYSFYDTYADLLDENGSPYPYATNGNLPEFVVMDGNYETALQELQTEGEDYDNSAFNVSAGLGLQFRLTKRLGLHVESNFHRMFTDRLDDVSDAYPANYDSAFQAYAANPTQTQRERRGNPDNMDWLAVHTLSIRYSFGKSKPAKHFKAPRFHHNAYFDTTNANQELVEESSIKRETESLPNSSENQQANPNGMTVEVTGNQAKQVTFYQDGTIAEIDTEGDILINYSQAMLSDAPSPEITVDSTWIVKEEYSKEEIAFKQKLDSMFVKAKADDSLAFKAKSYRLKDLQFQSNPSFSDSLQAPSNDETLSIRLNEKAQDTIQQKTSILTGNIAFPDAQKDSLVQENQSKADTLQVKTANGKPEVVELPESYQRKTDTLQSTQQVVPSQVKAERSEPESDSLPQPTAKKQPEAVDEARQKTEAVQPESTSTDEANENQPQEKVENRADEAEESVKVDPVFGVVSEKKSAEKEAAAEEPKAEKASEKQDEQEEDRQEKKSAANSTETKGKQASEKKNVTPVIVTNETDDKSAELEETLSQMRSNLAQQEAMNAQLSEQNKALYRQMNDEHDRYIKSLNQIQRDRSRNKGLNNPNTLDYAQTLIQLASLNEQRKTAVRSGNYKEAEYAALEQKYDSLQTQLDTLQSRYAMQKQVLAQQAVDDSLAMVQKKVEMQRVNKQATPVVAPPAATKAEPKIIEKEIPLAYDNLPHTELFFSSGSASIDDAEMKKVVKIYKLMERYPDLGLTLTGMADATGNASVNEALSKKRAAAVKSILVDTFGIAANRIAVESVGAKQSQGRNALDRKVVTNYRKID